MVGFKRFLYLFLSFIIGSFFLLLGIFSLILSWSPLFQERIFHFISENRLIFSLFGLGFALVGLSIIIYSSLQTGHRYVQIRTGDFSVNLDENVVKQYLETYWKDHFPQTQIPFSLTFKKHSLQIAAHFPSLPLEEQQKFLERVKKDFNDLFGRLLGYPYDVQLSASFSSENKKKGIEKK